MADTIAAPANKAVNFKGTSQPMRELAGAAKIATVRKKAKKAITRGLISEKAAARHLSKL